MFSIATNSSQVIFGGFAALIAALLWAVAAIIFRRLGENIPPGELNLIKGSLAVLLMIATTLILNEALPIMPALTIILLLISGIVGIGIGDTAYFESLNYMGSRLALLLGMIAPPLTGILAWLFFRETISLIGWLGIAITIGGVAWVITEEQSAENKIKINYKQGLKFAVIASLSQSIGAVISRYAMTEQGVTVSALQTAIIRLLAGIVYLIIFIAVSKKTPFLWLRKDEHGSWISSWKLVRMIALVGFIGTYSAIWLQQVSIQYAPVAIAQTLLSTSPLFILPIIALRGEKLSFRAVVGAIIALAGIVLLFTR
jgi:drug/metabolite transporter (DMT)-like permease